MNLFDALERHDTGPALYAEPLFQYLNRSARVESVRIRRELEEWFSHYPASRNKEELRRRFRSRDDEQHLAAFFELFLHELFLKLGYQVVLHPTLSKRGRIDFLVEPPHVDPFYVEATVVTGESREEAAARRRTNAVYDAINERLDSPNFYLLVKVIDAPRGQPPIKELVSFLRDRLAGLDPDEVARLYESGKEVPRWRFDREGWVIEFQPIPKKPEARGSRGVRPIGILATEARAVDHRTPIRDKIVDKGKRYGDLGRPFIVAVNALQPIDEDDILEALFGKEQWVVEWSEDDPSRVHPYATRVPDGAWTSKSGPRYTRISAILMVTRLSPWNVPQANLCLYHNPWARRPCVAALPRLSQVHFTSERWIRIAGESLGSIMGLPMSWPEEDRP